MNQSTPVQRGHSQKAQVLHRARTTPGMRPSPALFGHTSGVRPLTDFSGTGQAALLGTRRGVALSPFLSRPKPRSPFGSGLPEQRPSFFLSLRESKRGLTRFPPLRSEQPLAPFFFTPRSSWFEQRRPNPPPPQAVPSRADVYELVPSPFF